MNFGEMIRDLRKTKGFTQTDFAELLSLDRTQITNIELGTSSTPVPNVQRLCDRLDVVIYCDPDTEWGWWEDE